MKFKVRSEVLFGDMVITDTYVHEFADDSNVFGRVLEYHQRMYKAFPNCRFRLIEAKELKGEQQ